MDNKIRGRILIVDDQETWREVLTDVLTKEGHKVKTVETFEDAVREISENKFDLCLSFCCVFDNTKNISIQAFNTKI